jgi:dihydroxyacetone kinase
MALHHVAGTNPKESKGVLLIIKNYTGDVINFELAAQYARSAGINV